MPWFLPLVAVVALELAAEITGHTGAKPLGGLVLRPFEQLRVGAVGGEHAVVAPVHPVRIALVPDARLPVSISRPAVEEAAAVWAPYGVTIAAPEAPAPCPLPDAPDAVLTVRLEDAAVAGGIWSAPFASIRFLDGVPDTTILLHYENLRRLGLATIEIAGAHEAQWPRRLRDKVLSRMIGRVLAHEIGHWLLRTRGHSATGLMRAIQDVGELAEPGRTRFRLDPGDVVRLRETVVLR
jgi:hypothetical protein